MCRSLQRATVQRRPAYAAMHDLCMICAACRPALGSGAEAAAVAVHEEVPPVAQV